MLRFLKENGFPQDLIFDTREHEDKEKGFKGFKTVVTNGKGKVLKEFTHKDMRARVHWADGYFTALRSKNKKQYLF